MRISIVDTINRGEDSIMALLLSIYILHNNFC